MPSANRIQAAEGAVVTENQIERAIRPAIGREAAVVRTP